MKNALTALFMVFALWGNAQAPLWRTFDSSNVALPTNIIISLAVDNNNQKWVGTYSGLVKTDGFTWTTYNTANSGLPNDIVRGIAVDNSNTVWVATLNGLASFNGTDWTLYYNDTTNANPVLFLCIAADNLGNIYAGTEGNGLFWYNGTTWQQFTAQNSTLPQNRIESIAIKGQGILWLGTNTEGLLRADLTTPTFTSYNTQNSNMPFDFVKTVTLGTDGNIWAGTGSNLVDSGLVAVNPQTAAITVYDEATTGIANMDKVWAITFEGNDLYVGNNDSIFGFATRDTSGWATVDFNSAGLASNFVYSILVDDSSYKWVGTFNGLSVYSQTGVNVSTNEQPVAPFSVKAYPQPATNKVMFAVNLSQPQKMLVEIYGLDGNLMDIVQTNLSGKDVIEYDSSGLAQGMYIARFIGDKQSQAIKFIISQR